LINATDISSKVYHTMAYVAVLIIILFQIQQHWTSINIIFAERKENFEALQKILKFTQKNK